MRLFQAAAMVLVVLLCHGGRARADIIGTVDENGHGSSLVTETGQTATFTGHNGVDPFDLSNGLNPLIYDIGNTTNPPRPLVVGDLLIQETAGSSTLSDLVRFTTDPTTGDNLLIIYSVAGPGQNDLADVGIPSALQTNTLALVETVGADGSRGIFGYTPTPNQPGYIPLPANFGSVVYNVISDAAAVPEPSSVLMAATAALAGLGVWVRKQRSASRAG
jgi:hypothetical protein